MVNTSPLSDQEIDELFIHDEPPAPNTFETALVLGGTVSTGALRPVPLIVVP
jgi:hypothetical protein